jgi:hypothetical protein
MFSSKVFHINKRSKAIFYHPSTSQIRANEQIIAPTVNQTVHKQKATQTRWLPRQAASQSLEKLHEVQTFPDLDYSTEIRMKAHESLGKL